MIDLKKWEMLPFYRLVSNWVLVKDKTGERLGQFFINHYMPPDYQNNEIYYSHHAMELIIALYAQYDWPYA